MADDLTRQYERQLRANITAINNRIRKIYEAAITEITFKASIVNYNGNPFRLSDYPLLNKQVDSLINKMQPSIYAAVVNSIKTNWDLSNKKNDVLLDKRLAGRRPKPKVRQVLFDPNHDALKAFIDRKEKGINLSDRVWSSVETLRGELQQSLGLGISKGQSAITMANDLKKYLNNPTTLFRRVKNEDGKLVLSKVARNFHPGQGVYRSSYQNALRLAGTETNIAYRTSDFTRWQNLPFVTGVEVHTSNNHPTPDICDELAGEFPKDFVFKGWHPRCRCYATTKQMTDADYDELENKILNGDPIGESDNAVTEPHNGFTSFIRNNQDKIKSWKSKPYFLTDNKKYVDEALNKKAKPLAPGPSGNKIKPQFTKIATRIKSKVAESLRSIDEVHGDGTLDDIPFKSTSSGPYNASFASTSSGKAVQINLSTKPGTGAFDITHEMGHYLDLYSIGQTGRFSSLDSNSPIADVINVAMESSLLQSIKDSLKKGTIVFQGKEIALSPMLRNHLKYLVSPKEVWARSYAQFITERSTSAEMKIQMSDLIDQFTDKGFNYQWTTEEFSPIAQEIEKAFVKLGWITNQ